MMDELREAGCQFDPEQHEIVAFSPYISAIRNQTGVKDLGLYRHRESGNFMIFVWWRKDPPIMCEIWNCGPCTPDMGGNAPTREQLMAVLKPTAEVYEKIRQHNLTLISAEKAKKEELLNNRNSKASYYKRHGLERLGQGIETGEIPWAPADEQLTDFFRSRGKITVQLS
jgi:hypothetical protein